MRALGLLVAACLVTVACSDSSTSNQDGGSLPDAATQDAVARKDIVDTAVGAGSFTTLVAAVQAAGLESTLRSPGPFTVFAPNDAAFKKLPGFLLGELTSAPYKTELGLILKYHVVAGNIRAADVLGKKQSVATASGAKLEVDGSNGKVVLDGATNVSTADVLASNGVIHVLDGVLLPTILDTAKIYDDGTTKFSKLAGAVQAAGLDGALSSAGTFTVFAPTDAAFANLEKALGSTTYNAILADKAKLTKVLQYHVLAQQVFSPDVKSGDVTTLAQSPLTITVANGKVTITDSTKATANVVLVDLPNRNGVIHVIDKVLVPPNL